MEYLMGVPVIAVDWLTERVQARTHKKRRINKKWLKRYGYKTVPDRDVYFCKPGPGSVFAPELKSNGYIFGHKSTIDKFIERVKKDSRYGGNYTRNELHKKHY